MSGNNRSIWSVARRRLGLEASPLRRASDRCQARARVAVLGLLVVSCVIAVLAGQAAYHKEAAQADTDAERGYRATATVASTKVSAADPQSGATQRVVEITWRDTDSSLQRQRLVVPKGNDLGRTTTVWVDARGHASLQPPAEGRSVASGIGAAALVVFTSLLLLIAAYGLVVLALNRRRMAAWQRQWAAVEPEWRRRAL